MVECRVRYLSFLGIGKNVKQCAFIMHTTQDLFIAHVFECEPSAGTLCKTIEAACKVLRNIQIIKFGILSFFFILLTVEIPKMFRRASARFESIGIVGSQHEWSKQ